MLTVLMATYNGAQTLPDVLEAFCQLEEPPGGWRMVVIDNGSVDETQAIVQSYTKQLPITILYEPVRGKNIALNSSLDNIIGDLAVFTDDDILPQPDWLVKIREVADSHPSISIFGGVVLPNWGIPPAAWLRNLEWPYMGVSFTLTDPALAEGPVEPDYIVGGNMAIRTDIFKTGHRFDVTIGPDGSASYPMGSETELIACMFRQGYKLWYCKQPVVYHSTLSNGARMDPQASNSIWPWKVSCLGYGCSKYFYLFTYTKIFNSSGYYRNSNLNNGCSCCYC